MYVSVLLRADLVLTLFSVPAKFLDNSVTFSRGSTTVNVQGKWSYPITLSPRADFVGKVSLNNAVFYQNKDNLMVDTILLNCHEDNASLLVCGYDYQKVEDGEITIPFRIEIYQAEKSGIPLRRLVKIDVSSIEQL